MRLCLAVTSWFHKPCRQLDDRFFVMDSCFAHTLKKYKWSTCWRKCWILFSIKQKHTSDFEHRFKWALLLCKDNPCTWQVQDVQFYHTSDLFGFFFQIRAVNCKWSELLLFPESCWFQSLCTLVTWLSNLKHEKHRSIIFHSKRSHH